MTRAAEKARELLEEQRLSVKHNEKWLTAALTEARREEREACAKVADKLREQKMHPLQVDTFRIGQCEAAQWIAERIRSREEG